MGVLHGLCHATDFCLHCETAWEIRDNMWHCQVWVKVVDIQQSDGPLKINCSMKAVSQEDGSDLDPQNQISKRPAAGSNFRGPVSDSPPEVRRF